ncbi:MAG: alpha-L-fucosidase [Propionibacteriales bacterium]|nr:alpha-L-fucosidase [Propionibacteriales bacterium]
MTMRTDLPPAALHCGAQREGRRTDLIMNQFRHDRFGQFLQWGLYSIPAGVWRGTDHGFAAEFLARSAKIPPAEWARLAEQFTAEFFDPVGWAQMAKAMGARYVTITGADQSPPRARFVRSPCGVPAGHHRQCRSRIHRAES